MDGESRGAGEGRRKGMWKGLFPHPALGKPWTKHTSTGQPCLHPQSSRGTHKFSLSRSQQLHLVPVKSATQGGEGFLPPRYSVQRGGGKTAFLRHGCPSLYLPAWKAARSSSCLPAHIWREPSPSWGSLHNTDRALLLCTGIAPAPRATLTLGLIPVTTAAWS